MARFLHTFFCHHHAQRVLGRPEATRPGRLFSSPLNSSFLMMSSRSRRALAAVASCAAVLAGALAPAPALAQTVTIASAQTAAAAPRIEANKASQAELEMVKGIGPQLSSRMLAERTQHAFKDWPDFIQRMPGIGPVKAAKLSAAGLLVNGGSYSAPAAAVSAPAAGKAASRPKGA